VYLFCLVAGLGFAIASGFLGSVFHTGDGGDAGLGHDVGFGHDAGTDVHVGASTDHGVGVGHGEFGMQLSPLSPPIMSTFLAGFGMVGMIGERGLHLPWFVSGPLAIAFSLGIAVLAFVAIGRLMAGSQGSSHVRFADLVGTEAEVTTPIPAEGLGEIAFDTPTGRTSHPARSETGEAIPKHSMVTISQVVGNVAMVRETIDEQLRSLGRTELASSEPEKREMTERQDA
jgi:membrane protein implicated in regulation of membrane protease activity